MAGIVVQAPVDRLGPQRPMEALQETELARRAVADAHVAEVSTEMRAEPLGEERRAVVGDEERRAAEPAVDRLGVGFRRTPGSRSGVAAATAAAE